MGCFVLFCGEERDTERVSWLLSEDFGSTVIQESPVWFLYVLGQAIHLLPWAFVGKISQNVLYKIYVTICQSMGTQWLPGCFSSRVTQWFPENCRAQPLKLGHLVLRVNGRDYGLLSGWQGKNVRAANNCLASWRPLKRALCNNSSGGSSHNITWDAFSWARQQRVTLRFLTPGSGSVTAPAISRMQLSLAHKLTIQRNNWSCLVKFSMTSHEVHVKIHASSTNRILWGGDKNLHWNGYYF